MCAAIAPSVATFTNALELFRGGASASAVHAALCKYQKFKAALLSAPEFAAPAPVKKRVQPVEQKKEEMNTSPAKIQRTSPEASIGGGKVVTKLTEQKPHPFFEGFSQPKRQKVNEEEKKDVKMVCLHQHLLTKMDGDEEIICDVCSSEDCTAGYYNCSFCKLDFCLECYNKAIVEESEIAASEIVNQRDYNAEIQPEDQELGAGE